MDKRAIRRQLTEKIANRRWQRLMEMMQPMESETLEEARARQIFTRGHYRKFNGDCGCPSCRAAKQYDKYKRPARSSLKSGVELEI